MHLVALALAAFALLNCGCKSYKLTRLDEVPSDEAVVIGKMRILHNGEDKTDGSMIYFNAPATGFPKYAAVLDKTGYFFVRVPLGDVSMNHIILNDSFPQKHFPKGQLAFHLDEARAIYYAGDITLDWNGPGAATSWVIYLIGGLPAGAITAHQGKIGVSVESNLPPVQGAFRRKFPNDRPVIPALLVAKPDR
jgi:hypothetical protein